MGQQRRKPNNHNNSNGHAGHGGQANQQRPKDKSADLWRLVPALPDPLPIVPADDVTALVRSLGDPPLPGKSVVAGHYVAAVVERAAALATALATSADLLGHRDDD